MGWLELKEIDEAAVNQLFMLAPFGHGQSTAALRRA